MSLIQIPARLMPFTVPLLLIGGFVASAQRYYVVQPGDTLFSISLRNGTTVEALAQANGILPPYVIHAGFRLFLAELSASAQRYYVVQPGDTLFSISLKTGTTPEALAVANGIASPYTIHAGFRLLVADPNDLDQHYYILRPRDTLFRIAKRKGTTVEALAEANGILPPYIVHEGNMIVVPVPWCPPEESEAPTALKMPDVSDPNLCHKEWMNCGDGSTPESVCRWQVGWCMANLGLSAEECRIRYCDESPPGPTVTRVIPRQPDPESKPDPPPVEEPRRCVLNQRFDEHGNDITSVVEVLRWKECLAGAPYEHIQG